MKQRQSKDIEIVRTTIRVPRHLWDQTKHRAIEERLPLQDLIIRALGSYLKTKAGRP